MPALFPNISHRLRIVGVNLYPENIQVFNAFENIKETFGIRVEVEIDQYVDIRSGTVTKRLKAGAYIAVSFW